jgi:peptide/nickel transport system permease protein
VTERAERVPAPIAANETDRLWSLRWRRFKRSRMALASLIIILAMLVAVWVGPALYGRNPYAVDSERRLSPPGQAYPLGADDIGRDILARLLHGGRVSLTVGVVAMSIAVVIGALVGSLSGYFEGWIDTVAMRITDAMLSLPTFFFLLAILSLFGGGAVTVVFVIGITSWMRAARVVRGEFLRWKVSDFVIAARAQGALDSRIIGRHIMPQAVSSLVVEATLGVAYAILTESSLSFLGLGIQAPTPTWGNMLFNAQAYVWQAPIIAVWPGLMILVTVLSFNSFGDGLRDALDPRVR